MEEKSPRFQSLKQLLAVAGIGFLILVAMVAYDRYEGRVREPRGRFTTIDEFVRVMDKSGESQWCRVQFADPCLYEAFMPGRLGGSGNTSYLFNEHGQFVDWVIDVSDFPGFHQKYAPKGWTRATLPEIRAEIAARSKR